MSNYFRYFPIVEYNKFLAKNITANVRMDKQTRDNAMLFHVYAQKNGDNARTIAGKYYDDENLDWLVYFANEVIDPYYDVYLDSSSFEQYIIEKYGSLELAQQLTAGWINDWRSDDSEISIATYEALLPSQKKYYDPQIDLNRSITSYKRAQIEMRTNTNRIIKWQLATSIDAPTTRQLLDIYSSSTKIGMCEVVSVDDDNAVVQHVILTDDSTPTHVALWNDDQLISIADTIQDYDAIPVDEVAFWVNVSNYDAEYSANEAKKNLKLISNQFSGEFKRQLKDKLR
jgi:hypothetical protein